MKTINVIYNGKKMTVLSGFENNKKFIIVDGNKVYENKTSPYIKLNNQGEDLGSYIDCCDPYVKGKTEPVKIGDYLYASIKGCVRKVQVKKIAEKPYHIGYGMCKRKLLVINLEEGNSVTINDPMTCIFCGIN